MLAGRDVLISLLLAPRVEFGACDLRQPGVDV
jgi:hypothetical protein